MLAIVRFLYRLTAFCQVAPTNKHRLASDNQGRIMRVAQLTTNKYTNPNNGLHRQNTSYIATCPACCTETETLSHMSRCTDESRAAWRALFICELTNTCTDHDTDPTLQAILVAGFNSTWTNSFVETAQYPLPYRPLIESQTAIGWSQLFNG